MLRSARFNLNRVGYKYIFVSEFNSFLASGLLVIVSGVSGFAQYQKPPDFLCPEFGKISLSHINNIFAPRLIIYFADNCRRVPV